MALEGVQQLTLPTKSFVGFIQSILSVYRGGVSLTIHDSYIDTLVLSEDNASIILYASVALLMNSAPEREITIHVRDLTKFILLSNFSKSESFTFKLQNNYVYFEDSKVRGAKFILDESPARKLHTNISINWFNKFEPYFKAKISKTVIKEILKISSFANDSDKIYIYEDPGTIVAELNDKEKVNIDNIKLNLTNQYTGHILDKIILDVSTLQSLSSITDELIMEVSKIQNHEALFFTMTSSNILLKYLFASKLR